MEKYAGKQLNRSVTAPAVCLSAEVHSAWQLDREKQPCAQTPIRLERRAQAPYVKQGNVFTYRLS